MKIFLLLFILHFINKIVFTLKPSSENRARQLLANMTLTEKLSFLQGVPGDYVGNLNEIPRLKISKMNLEDGPQGVADGVKDVTNLPSVLAVTASWDRKLMESYGTVLGDEQRKKGTNVHLGPMVNIARVPKGGRNFEAMGEDTFLASELVSEYIKGVQSQNIIACVKHWVNNEQETHRSGSSSMVDERTLHEIYYPPFVSAVNSGVGSVMCSYNRINGTYACENKRTINHELKGRMGFKGWVMSDWWAQQSTYDSFKNGLDQEMPNDEYYGDKIIQGLKDGIFTEEEIDDKVYRMLSQIIEIGVYDNPTTGNINSNARSEKNTKLARHFSEESMVLLKNEDKILPIQESKIKKIAIIGDVGHDLKLVSGGGSGHVDDSFTISPLEGIRNRANNQTEVSYLNSSNFDSAIELAKNSDIVIFISGAESGEGSDRENLNLIGKDDELIFNLAKVNKNIIVVLHHPASILLPWIKKVRACIASFYPGEQAGNSLASILFGDVNPSGKLPITLPKYENQTSVNDPRRYPGIDNNPEYSEKLLVGYKWNNENSIEPEFYFGHGLSYTTFKFDQLKINQGFENVSIKFTVHNEGKVYGKEVAQLYLTYPKLAEEPPKILKGFEKVSLNPKESIEVEILLDKKAFSIWDVEKDNWNLIGGKFTINIGSSVNDIKLKKDIKLNENSFKGKDNNIFLNYLE